MGKIKFAIVGSGWRAGFYIRIAKVMSDKYDMVGVLCRSDEKVGLINSEYGVYATTSEQEICDKRPDFIVVAVNKTGICEVSKYWNEKGFTVLCETPLGMTSDELEDIQRRDNRRLVVAEQYCYYPVYKAIIDAIKEGKIGEPVSAYVSLAHEYHGMSLIRAFLNEGYDTPYTMRMSKYELPVTRTGDRYNVYTDGELIKKPKTVINIEYEDGKVCLYDFEAEQYHSLIRHNSVKISGTRGEIIDNKIWYLDENNIGREEILFEDLHSVRAEGNTDPLCQDEIAIEAIMEKAYYVSLSEDGAIAEWQRNNINCALQDAYFMLRMKEG